MNSPRRRHGKHILAAVSAIMLAMTVTPSVAVGQPEDPSVTDALTATGVVPANAVKDHGEVDEDNLDSSTNPTCSDIVMVGVPGTFEINQNSDPNEPNGLLGKMAEPLRGQDWFSETYVNYVSDMGVNGTSYAQSVDGGVRKTLATIKDVQDRCDESRVFLTGFSQGADIAGDVATLIGNKSTDIEAGRIAGVTLFSDPQRSSGTNVIADTSRDLPVLPLAVSDAVDNFVNDQSLAQVQMGVADAAELAGDVSNAFGVGGRGSEPQVPAGDDAEKSSVETTSPQSTSESESASETTTTSPESDDAPSGSDDNSNDSSRGDKDDEKGRDSGGGNRGDRDSGDSGSGNGNGNEPSEKDDTSDLFGNEMMLSSHGTVGSDEPSYSPAVANTSQRTEVKTVSDSGADDASVELIEQSSLGDTLSDEDKQSLAESMTASDGVEEDPDPDQRTARQDLQAAAYMTGLFVKTSLAGMEAGASADAELFQAMDNESLKLLADMEPSSAVEPIPEDQQDEVKTRCRTLRFSDCTEEIDSTPQRSQEVSDSQFAAAVSDSGRGTEYDDQDSDAPTDTNGAGGDSDASDNGASGGDSDDSEQSATEDTTEATEEDSERSDDSATTTPSTDNEDADQTPQTDTDDQDSQDDSPRTDEDDEDTDQQQSAESSDAQLPESDADGSDGPVGSSSDDEDDTPTSEEDEEDGEEASDADELASLWSGTTNTAEGGQLAGGQDDDQAPESDDETTEDTDSSDQPDETTAPQSSDEDEGEATEEPEGQNGDSSADTAQAATEDVDIDQVTEQGVAGGGLAGERDQGFGELTGRVASLCPPGDLVCDLAPNSDLAKKLVDVGQEFSLNASEVDQAASSGDTEGLTRMGGLLAVQAVGQVAEVSGLPAPKLSADSITALIKIAAGASMVANGDPTGAGVTMIGSTMDDLPTVLPELAAQIGDIPEILESLPDAGDTAAKNLGLEKLQTELSGAFNKAKIGDVTDLSQLPQATAGLIGDMLENNEGLLEMATDPSYYQNAHSVAGFTSLMLGESANAMQWTSDWIRQVDQQGASSALSDNVNPRTSAGRYNGDSDDSSDADSSQGNTEEPTEATETTEADVEP